MTGAAPSLAAVARARGHPANLRLLSSHKKVHGNHGARAPGNCVEKRIWEKQWENSSSHESPYKNPVNSLKNILGS